MAVAKQMPQTRLITVTDREGDIFELFAEAEATRKRVGLLVRAQYDRRLEGREQKLFETLQASKNETRVEVSIPRQRGKQAKGDQPEQKALPGREATLTVRFEKTTVVSTRSDLRSSTPITLWGVYVREENPPPDTKPIEWLLLKRSQGSANSGNKDTVRWQRRHS